MNSMIHLRPTTPVSLVVLLLAWFAIAPLLRAVVPAPDGGYPNGNTAEGQNALQSTTTGGFNAAVGWFSLFANTTGSFNTAVGAGALDLNTADNNTAVGVAALLLNTTGTENTANGRAALEFNDTGTSNTAVGSKTLLSNTSGNLNTASGVEALEHNTIGTDNTANGVDALFSNTTGSFNTANGVDALVRNTTGSENTALGVSAGANQTTGSNNVYIGAGMSGIAGEVGACYIANIFSQTSASGLPVLINAFSKLGTTTSSRRFKEDIKQMDKASEALLALKPVTFHYKKEIDPAGMQQFGLVAEEVEEVNPDLVVRDKEGKPYSVRYDQVNAMLLNEFLKEHRKNQEQEATIAQLKKEMETVVARLKEDDSRIQAVSARIEVSKAVERTALNDP